jgi:predicted permease
VLFAAGLIVRSLQKLMTQDFGYDRSHVVIARLDPMAAGYKDDKMKLLAQQLMQRVSETPGVRSVTYSVNGLFAHTESGDAILVPGFKSSDVRDRVANEDYVGPNYFGVVGIPIVAGRGIEAQDTPTSMRVAVVNEAMVKYFFQGKNPVGREFLIDDPDWAGKPFTIVGVSRDAKDHGSGLREAVKPRFYQAFQQTLDAGQIILEVEVSGAPSAAITSIVGQIKQTDTNLPISFIRSLDSLVSSSVGDQIALAELSAFFGGLALVLACIGLYGIVSYNVAGRTREIGVRMALGAARLNVLQLILREGLMLVALGLALGIPLALAGSRLLANMLYELKSNDPLSLFGTVAVLAVVATLAGYIPARRATKVDPMVALRHE